MVSCTAMYDYHIHTSLCKHAGGQMFEYVECAVAQGLEEICFTDHNPLPAQYDTDHRMALHEMDLYMEEIERLRQKYPEITILAGIEADYIEGCEEFLADFLAAYPLDLVMMSIHSVTGWPPGNWVFAYNFPQKTLYQVYSEYLDTVLAGIETGLFDVLGHLDIVKQPDYPLLETNSVNVNRVLDAAGRRGMAMEINTSGLRKNVGEIFPAAPIVSMAAAKGIPLVVGSDAHLPHQVGYKFSQVLQDLRKICPNLETVRFRRRKIVAGNLFF